MRKGELRCGAKLHAVLIDSDTIEVACDSRFCGAVKGVVVRHRLSLSTGEVISTQKFKQPPIGRSKDATTGTNTAVRAS